MHRATRIRRLSGVLIALFMFLNVFTAGAAFADSAGETSQIEADIHLLKSYYQQRGVGTNGAIAVRSMTGQAELDGMIFTGIYLKYGSAAKAAIDQMAMNENPRAYQETKEEGAGLQNYDLIRLTMDGIQEDGTFKSPRAGAYGILALEIFYDGKEWKVPGGTEEQTRTRVIEGFLSNMYDSVCTKGVASMKWSVEGGRFFTEPDYYTVAKVAGQIADQEAAVALLSRWLSEETLVTVDGKQEMLKDVAAREAEGILYTLEQMCRGEVSGSNADNRKAVRDACLRTQRNGKGPLLLSTFLSGGKPALIEELGLLDGVHEELAKYRAEDGGYQPVIENVVSHLSSANACAKALGDYQNQQAILSVLSFDPQLNALDTVAWDLEALNLPEQAAGNLALETEGSFGSTIVWQSSNEAIIDPLTGAVTFPQTSEAVVMLTATASYGEVSDTKVFYIAVAPIAQAGDTTMEEAYRGLRIPLFTADDSILLPAEVDGYQVTWRSGDPSIIDNEGNVSKSAAEEQEVLLTAEIIADSISRTKEFPVTVGISNPDMVTQAVYQARAYYDVKRDLSGGYWDVWAAKAIFGDDYDKYDFQVYNVKAHRPNTNWAGTDYGAVILQILAQGDNPYSYQGVNYVERMLKYVERNGEGTHTWGGYGEPIFLAMALDAAGAMTPELYKDGLRNQLRGQLINLDWGPDLAGWSMVPLGTRYGEDAEFDAKMQENLALFKKTMLERMDRDPKSEFYGLFVASNLGEYSHVLSTNCVLLGSIALQNAGIDGFDLTAGDWLMEDGTGALEAVYNDAFKDKEAPYNTQVVITFGDLYQGENVWASVDIEHEQLETLLAETRAVAEGDGSDYTEKTFGALLTAYQEAKSYEKQEYGFGAAYFALKEAYEGLKPAETISVQIFGNDKTPYILTDTSVNSGHSYLELIPQAARETSFSYTLAEDSVTELGGLKASGESSWYCYDGEERVADLSTQPEEGADVTFKYCSDTGDLPAGTTLDAHLAFDAAEVLTITGEIDGQYVTGDLNLPAVGLFDTTVSWLSNKTFAVADTGKVTRDKKEDIKVKLTASVAGPNGEASERVFEVVVKATGESGGPSGPVTASISIAGPVKESWDGAYNKTALEIEPGETAFSLLEKTGAKVTANKNTQYGVYVQEINGLYEFDYGQESGWMYRVNGKFPGHSAAKHRVYEDDYVEWVYTKDLGRDVGGYVSGVGGGSGGVADKNSATIHAAASGTGGSVSATITEAQIKEHLDKKKLIVNVTADSGAVSVSTSLPAAPVKELAENNGALTVRTPLGEVGFDKEGLSAAAEQATGTELVLVVREVDASAVKELSGVSSIEGRPVFEIALMSGGKEIEDLKSGAVTLRLPYKLGSGEKESGVRIVRIGEGGTLNDLAECRYLKDEEAVSGSTNHLSYYAILYLPVNFTDVRQGQWFYDSVMYLAENGIVKGKSEDLFAPRDTITRAEFVQILYNKEGAPTSSESALGFTDVRKDAWYADAVSWASSAGLAKGTSKTEFSPAANITRQDMAVILSNYVNQIQKKPLTVKENRLSFTDGEKIAAYAKDAVGAMQAGGVIDGVQAADGSYSFNPRDNATRAEAAKMIAELLRR